MKIDITKIRVMTFKTKVEAERFALECIPFKRVVSEFKDEMGRPYWEVIYLEADLTKEEKEDQRILGVEAAIINANEEAAQ